MSLDRVARPGGLAEDDVAVMRDIEDRLLWLSTMMVHQANSGRKNRSGMKVGGHQASSASIVSIMTHLWFRHLRAGDRVSVKPHASPVLHAINYLLGDLEESWLTQLRSLGGLQAYPSRTKDPDTVDYSTGSMGLGATATVWGALARRYANGLSAGGAGWGRQYSLIGDAELDEGAVWEAVRDPQVSSLGELVWIVDLNRQSLDRVIPQGALNNLEGMFASAGWQTLTVRWGKRIQELFSLPGGDVLRRRLEGMDNPEYQRLLRRDVRGLRDQLTAWGNRAVTPTDASNMSRLLARLEDDELEDGVRDLGGHCHWALEDAFRSIDDSRPTVIFAHTIKGYRLPSEGHPQNHGSLLGEEDIARLARELGASLDDPWAMFLDGTLAARRCALVRERLQRTHGGKASIGPIPHEFGRTPKGKATTQAALGRVLLDLFRHVPDVARRVVTVSPDVASTTNLGGWVNKVGVWSVSPEAQNWFLGDGETILHWNEKAEGQHIELGIAEVNMVSLLGELGATWSRWGEPLLPIGVMYDAFVARALEPWIHGIYSGGQSILIGTPSGVTLAPEGGAHQSVLTPTIGLQQPGLVSYEPAFAIDTEWILLACLTQLGCADGMSAYLRLSTRVVDQTLAAVPRDVAARERRRRQVIAGAYALRRVRHPVVTLVSVGPVVTEALLAAERLAVLDAPADVVCVTSPDLVYRAFQARVGLQNGSSWILDQVFPASRATPLVTVLDGHPHTLSFLGAVNGVPIRPLGVTEFGQSGSLDEIYRLHGLDSDAIVAAALDLLG